MSTTTPPSARLVKLRCWRVLPETHTSLGSTLAQQTYLCVMNHAFNTNKTAFSLMIVRNRRLWRSVPEP
eukprot:6176535-Pleurochrysis_carterae.AAC.2